MFLRRIATSVVLLAFVGATVGVPIPETVEKTNEDFPCRYHACGCLDARMCRTNCCCFKPATKESSCCQSSSPDSESETSDEPPGRTVTLTVEALKCKGLAAVWANLGLLYCPNISVAVVSEGTVSDDRPVAHDHLRPLRSLEPALPPPRI